VIRCRDKNMIGPNWDVSDCKTGVDGPTRIMVGSDGVMVPLITPAEKQERRKNRRPRRRKRRKTQAIVVRRRKRKLAKRKRCRGADNAYKEFKIATFYDQGNEHQHAVGTAGNHQALGRLLRREAAKLHIDKADQKAALFDGAKWIRKQFQIKLPMLDVIILDYYHLTEHVAMAANVCFGQGSDNAQQWRKETLSSVCEQGPTEMLLLIRQTRKKFRAKNKREQLRKLEQYVSERIEMLDYPKFRKLGFDIGSGPTEAFCKTLTARLKGSGMRWDSPNAEGMMALAAIEQCGQWKAYWTQQYDRAA